MIKLDSTHLQTPTRWYKMQQHDNIEPTDPDKPKHRHTRSRRHNPMRPNQIRDKQTYLRERESRTKLVWASDGERRSRGRTREVAQKEHYLFRHGCAVGVERRRRRRQRAEMSSDSDGSLGGAAAKTLGTNLII
jgi:hypothetical protein